MSCGPATWVNAKPHCAFLIALIAVSGLRGAEEPASDAETISLNRFPFMGQVFGDRSLALGAKLAEEANRLKGLGAKAVEGAEGVFEIKVKGDVAFDVNSVRVRFDDGALRWWKIIYNVKPMGKKSPEDLEADLTRLLGPVAGHVVSGDGEKIPAWKKKDVLVVAKYVDSTLWYIVEVVDQAKSQPARRKSSLKSEDDLEVPAALSRLLDGDTSGFNTDPNSLDRHFSPQVVLGPGFCNRYLARSKIADDLPRAIFRFPVGTPPRIVEHEGRVLVGKRRLFLLIHDDFVEVMNKYLTARLRRARMEERKLFYALIDFEIEGRTVHVLESREGRLLVYIDKQGRIQWLEYLDGWQTGPPRRSADLPDTDRAERSSKADASVTTGTLSKRLKVLEEMGDALRDRHRFGEAMLVYEEAVSSWEKVRSESPRNAPDIEGIIAKHRSAQRMFAQSYEQELSALLAEGKYTAGEKLAALVLDVVWERFYPKDKYPDGHNDLVFLQNAHGAFLLGTGRIAEAKSRVEAAMLMAKNLRRRGGNCSDSVLASCHANFGMVLEREREYDEAEEHYRKALKLMQGAYPKNEYPDGHEALASTHNNLGHLYVNREDYASASQHIHQALEMLRRLHPLDKFPNGHPKLIASLNNLGGAWAGMRDLRRALACYEEALAMARRVYASDTHPDGHPFLANSLSNVGAMLLELSRAKEARARFEEALSIRKRLYPEAVYSQGHPDLCNAWGNLGFAYRAEGNHEAALKAWMTSQQMFVAQCRRHLGGLSEAEVLNLLVTVQLYNSLILSQSALCTTPADEIYAVLWSSRGLVHRALRVRHTYFSDLNDYSPAMDSYRTYMQCRRDLANTALAPAAVDPAQRVFRRNRLRTLTETKERLERELTGQLAGLSARLSIANRPFSDLVEELSPRTVFVDFVAYHQITYDPARPTVPASAVEKYAAFVPKQDGSVVRVDLGPAERMDRAVEAWRKEIIASRRTQKGEYVRKLLWAPVEQHLPSGTRAVYLCCDGLLHRVPWAALPGHEPTRILIEEYALAVVPYGQFLLNSKSEQVPIEEERAEVVLAVGDVAYDAQLSVPSFPADQPPAELAADRAGGVTWPPLRGVIREIECIEDLAERKKVTVLSGSAGSVSRVIAELPKARWAHFATHGFFADRKFRSSLKLDEQMFTTRLISLSRESAPMGRNPLILSGLVLAGANTPRSSQPTSAPVRDNGILTAESIASMPLDHLELVVLSACETGLGDVAGGEGVFGLQRAFHLAGAKSVVASLWKVDDTATAALMNVFYHKLWKEGMPPIEALREAQLTIYRSPERIADLAALRGAKFEEAIRGLQFESPRPLAGGESAPEERTASPKWWAAFVLSGTGYVTHQSAVRHADLAEPADSPQTNSESAAVESPARLFAESLATEDGDKRVELRRQIAQRFPDTPEGLFCRGFLAMVEDADYELAIDYYERALKKNPNFPQAHLNLGTACLATEVDLSTEKGKNRLQKAISHYRKSIEQDPNWHLAHAAISKAYLLADNVTLAIKHSAKAVSLNSKRTDYHANHATLLLRSGSFAEAVDHCNAALSLDPCYLPALNTKANALVNQGKSADAADIVATFAKVSPQTAKDFGKFFHRTAFRLREEEKHEAAFAEYLCAHKCYRAVVTTHPNSGAEEPLSLLLIPLLASGMQAHKVTEVESFILQNESLTRSVFDSVLELAYLGDGSGGLGEDLRTLIASYDRATGSSYFGKKHDYLSALTARERKKIGEIAKEVRGKAKEGERQLATGSPKNARGHFFSALRLCEDTGYRYGIPLLLEQTAMSYLNQQDHARAIEYLEKGVEAHKALDDVPRTANAMMTLWHLYEKTGENEKANNIRAEASQIFARLRVPEDVQ